MADLRWFGSLDDAPDQAVLDVEGRAVGQARAAVAAAAGPDEYRQALTAVREAVLGGEVLVDLSLGGGEALSITALEVDGADWVPVCSSAAELARWRQACGRGAERVHYATVRGDEVSALIGHADGIVLDPGSEAPLVLPAHRLTGEVEG